MDYTKLGRSGLDVSRLCLGCMSFGEPGRGADGWTLGEEDSLHIIRRALDLGINFFDTANIYSAGSSEEILGHALKKLARRDQVVVATKVFGPMREGPNAGGLSRKAIRTEAENSLRRLGTDYIDLYQIHRWDYKTPIEETLAALNDLIHDGLVRYIGASSMFAWQFAKALFIADLHGWARFASMQCHYNLLNREDERETIPLCLDQGVGCLPWSPLARGRLARDWTVCTVRSQDDAYGDSLYADTAETDARVTDSLAGVSRQRGIPRAQLALAWLLAKPVVTAPVIGVTRMEHLEQAAGALAISLAEDEIRLLEQEYIPHVPAGFE